MRGKKSSVGDTRIAPNGYHYTCTERGWELTHRIVASRKLGRELTDEERVSFVDGNRQNIQPNNLRITAVRKGSSDKQRARIQARITELQHQLEELEQESAK
jgi:hypothetical protein